MPRIFSAIELPDDLRDELYRLHQPMPGARWVHRGNYHISLRYLGDIDRSAARAFCENLADVELDPFEIRIVGLGVFGGHDPRSVFATVAPSPALEALARAHEKAARLAGFAPEKRPFRPHVTLARLKKFRSPSSGAISQTLWRLSITPDARDADGCVFISTGDWRRALRNRRRVCDARLRFRLRRSRWAMVLTRVG